jgi:hypothetical protein
LVEEKKGKVAHVYSVNIDKLTTELTGLLKQDNLDPNIKTSAKFLLHILERKKLVEASRK